MDNVKLGTLIEKILKKLFVVALIVGIILVLAWILGAI